MSFIVAPLSQVKKDYPEFAEVLEAVEQKTIERAKSIWGGFELGGTAPGKKQFGLANILPRMVTKANTVFGSMSWQQRFGSAGSWAKIFDYTVGDDEIHAYAGFQIPKEGQSSIFTALRVSIEKETWPIVEIEEARGYDGNIAFVIKTDEDKEMIVEEKQTFKLEGWVERGNAGLVQRVIPIGLVAYRKKDLLMKD